MTREINMILAIRRAVLTLLALFLRIAALTAYDGTLVLVGI